jgi:predicted RNase H-like HicB family nuclease
MTACTIRVERVEDGCYRATCTQLPDFEAVAATAEAARAAVEEALRRDVAARLGTDRGAGPVSRHEPH